MAPSPAQAPRILAFGASSSRHSINKALVTHAAERLQGELPDAVVEIIDLNDYEMPIYSTDREKAGGIPPQARRFYDQIGKADALLISYAEHNGNYTAAFKNLFDWTSRINAKVFQQRPMVVLATSPGGRGGSGVLRLALESAPHFGAEVVAHLSVPRFQNCFDLEAGQLTDPELSQRLGDVLEQLASRLRQ
ncbi:MAG: chromate reductase [Myxococcota bacterium]|jgi:chromate reductase